MAYAQTELHPPFFFLSLRLLLVICMVERFKQTSEKNYLLMFYVLFHSEIFFILFSYLGNLLQSPRAMFAYKYS